MTSFKSKLNKNTPLVIVGKVIFGALAITAFVFAFGYGIQWLWNWLMPDLFELPTISYWQAIGLFILSRILFSSGNFCERRKRERCTPKQTERSDWVAKLRHYSDSEECEDWKHYDEFWKHEGKDAYKNFVERSQHKEN